MTDWRLLYGPLNDSGDIEGELPCIGMEYQETLNGLGRWTATLPLDPDPARLPIPGATGGSTPSPGVSVITNQNLAVARTRVWFERDGVLQFPGILWTARANLETNTLDLAGEGIGSYFQRRTINATNVYDTDQFDIARDLLIDAQAVPNGNIGVDPNLAAGSTGVSRQRTWLHYERQNVGRAIEQLAAVDDGFDWRYHTAWDSFLPTVTFQPTYPAEGRRTAHVFEVGTNCALLSYSEDGTTVANVVHAKGAGDGEDALLVTAQNAALQGPYPILETVIAHNDVRILATLAAHARRRLARGAGPIRHVQLTTFPDTEPVLGSYQVGDQVTVRADHGWVQLDDWMRIVDMTVTIQGGSELVRLALAGLEVFVPV